MRWHIPDPEYERAMALQALEKAKAAADKQQITAITRTLQRADEIRRLNSCASLSMKPSAWPWSTITKFRWPASIPPSRRRAWWRPRRPLTRPFHQHDQEQHRPALRVAAHRHRPGRLSIQLWDPQVLPRA